MLTAGRPVVTDLGLASLVPGRVASGEPTAAADRYAFAAIAYQLLVDRAPFAGEGRGAGEGQPGAPAAPSLRNPALPASVDAILLRGLSRHPDDRWAACGQLVQALAAALGGRDAAPAAGAVDRTRARWGYVLAGAVGVLALGAGVAAGLASAGR